MLYKETRDKDGVKRDRFGCIVSSVSVTTFGDKAEGKPSTLQSASSGATVVNDKGIKLTQS